VRDCKHEADRRIVDRREGTLSPEVLLEDAVFEEAVQGAVIAVYSGLVNLGQVSQIGFLLDKIRFQERDFVHYF
jgi:hypothetical protein